jgi:inositol oxygenase
MANYRNYEILDTESKVEFTYKCMLENQNVEFVSKNKNIYTSEPFKKYNFWVMMDKLDTIIDESDPDTDLPQIIHNCQAAESIENRYISENYKLKNVNIKDLFNDIEWNDLPEKYKQEYNTTMDKYYSHLDDWSWFPLIGFFHDAGKVMLLDEFGKLPQWAVVGDTFPLGLKLADNFVYFNKNYHKENIDLQENKYQKYCGFNKLLFSWSHDEYMASFMERNGKFPDEATYIVRYHSFYSWHTPRNNKRGYTEFANEKDWKMLPLLKAFQKADLYSKTRIVPDIDLVKSKYNGLVLKYFEKTDLNW